MAFIVNKAMPENCIVCEFARRLPISNGEYTTYMRYYCELADYCLDLSESKCYAAEHGYIQEVADSCNDCLHENKELNEMPCSMCKRRHLDRYERKNERDGISKNFQGYTY